MQYCGGQRTGNTAADNIPFARQQRLGTDGSHRGDEPRQQVPLAVPETENQGGKDRNERKIKTPALRVGNHRTQPMTEQGAAAPGALHTDAAAQKKPGGGRPPCGTWPWSWPSFHRRPDA